MALPSLDDYFPDWKEREALAEAMIPLIGKLYRKNVVVYCYGRALYNQSVTQLWPICGSFVPHWCPENQGPRTKN